MRAEVAMTAAVVLLVVFVIALGAALAGVAIRRSRSGRVLISRPTSAPSRNDRPQP